MAWKKKLAWGLALVCLGTVPAFAQEAGGQESPGDTPQDEVEEVIVVTASRTE